MAAREGHDEKTQLNNNPANYETLKDPNNGMSYIFYTYMSKCL
jgi:hypothetical protein